MFLDKKTLLKMWLIPGLNLTIFRIEERVGAGSQRPGNFSGPKANFEIKTCLKVAQFLPHKSVSLASLTDSFIVSFSKLMKLWSWMQTRQT